MGPLESESGAPAVRVVASFDGAIVEVRYLVDCAREQFRIGAGAFPLDDPRLPEAGLPLVRGRDGGFDLVFTDALSGAVRLDGDRVELSLPSLIARGLIRPEPELAGAYFCPLAFGATFRLTVGALAFEVAACVPPARLGLAPRRDWIQLLLTGATALAMTLCLLVYLIVPRGISDETLSDAVVARAHFLFPTDAGHGASPFGAVGQAPAAPGRSFDKRATPGARTDARVARARPRPVRTSPVSGAARGAHRNRPAVAPEAARASAARAAHSAGILDALGEIEGTHLGSVFGADDALGEGAAAAMGSLHGDDVGAGSLDAVGSDVGGGKAGEGARGTIGVTIICGGSDMTGALAAPAIGLISGRHATDPSVRMRAPEVGPEYDPALIRRVVHAHRAEVRFCYERSLLAHPQLDGRLMMQFTVATSGRVTASAVTSSTVGDPAVGACVAQAIGRWTFPAPRGGSILIRYPFVFARAE
jgi:TonB family protein